ncbi:MAG: hypothetical protein MUF62_05385 [Chitinophagaceae bacterium]|nr:hypothetical protein [Chitinophagaceae bacterium]
MKKVLLLLCLAVGMAQVSVAQIKLPGASDVLKNFIAPPSFTDAGKTASGIADLLGSKLSLSGDQKKSTLDAVTGFLGQKKDILGLAKSNPADYLKKFNPLQQGLFGKLKTILGAAKFANFLKLKPTGNGAGNLLSNLFF